MRRLLLVLALLVTTPAWSQDTPSTESAATPESIGTSPATVLSHEVSVVIDGSKRATTTTTWVVRIDDPAACAAGLIAPGGLDGAADGDGMVLEDTLLVGAGAKQGTTYTLTQTVRAPNRGSHSGAFLTAPDLPTQSARFSLKAPGWEPLHVWHDSGGTPDIGTRGGRTVEVVWSDLDSRTQAETVWSTWKDWMSAGTEISGLVDSKIATKNELGREMSDGYTGMHVAEASERMAWGVELDPNGSGDWTQARDAVDVLNDKRGSPVDRGVVLLSLLRLAGYDAKPGYYRPAGTRGSFPITIPAPAMLGRAMIVVERESGTVYIDPATNAIAVPEMPAALRGGVTWLPGDLPTPLVSDDAVDGVVTLNGSLTVDPKGGATWTAELNASGSAQERLRQLLGPLDEKGQSEAIQRLVQASRPGLQRFKLTASGIEKTSKQLKISVSGKDDALLESIGSGLTGEVPAILAPALASWLPPNLTIRESLSIAVPQAVEIVAAAPPNSAYTEAALLARRTERTGSRVSLVTEVTRPYRVSTAAIEVGAKQFLDSEAQRGPYLVIHAPANRDSIKTLRAAALDPVDKLVLEGVLWYRQRIGLRTAKSLRTAIKDFGGERTAAAVLRYGGDERRVWEMFVKATQDHGTAADRISVAHACEQAEYTKLAWLLAADVGVDDKLTSAERASGLLLQARLQPAQRPAEADDRQGFDLWTEPSDLIAQAESLVGEGEARILLFKAKQAITDEAWSDASGLLARIPEGSRTPVVEALHAQALAESDAAAQVVTDRLDKAMAAAPQDPEVLGAAAAINVRIGKPRDAKRYALTAARLQNNDPDRWNQVVTTAMAAGDLPTAGQAARTAAELDRKNLERAETLAMVSALLHDADGWKRARDLNPEALGYIQRFPPPLATLMEIAPPEAMLAVLQQHDGEVVADPILLGIRAQMRLDAGLLDEAARDGVLLAQRHGQADGVSLAYAASAGRMYSTTWKKRLDDAAGKSIASRATRMEVALVLGTSDPYYDAIKMDGDPRAEIIKRLRTDAKGLAGEVEGWPIDARSPTFRPPSGYRANTRLGASPGVYAVSNGETSTAILHSVVSGDGLPAPLHQLFTPNDQILDELPGGGTVVRLDGGPLPLFLARAHVEAEEPYQVLTLGFSVEAASRALAIALEE